MRLFVIANKYLPLININLRPGMFRQPITARSVTTNDFRVNVLSSSQNFVFGCTDINAAVFAARCLLKPHNSMPASVEPGINIFGTSVVYDAELFESELSEPVTLTGEMLAGYADTTTIPMFVRTRIAADCESGEMAEMLKLFKSPINVHRVDRLRIGSVTAATYFNVDGETTTRVNFAPAAILTKKDENSFNGTAFRH